MKCILYNRSEKKLRSVLLYNMSMTRIYFIRHGAVENPRNIFYGRLSRFPLSETGEKQIEKAAKLFQQKNIAAIYTSPLLRAVQTARILQTQLNMRSFHNARDLLEVRTSLQGKSYSYLRLHNYNVFSSKTNPIIAESIPDILKRMQRFVIKINKAYPDQAIIAVSHGDPIMILRFYTYGLPLTNEMLRAKNGQWNGRDYIRPGEVYEAQCGDRKTIRMEKTFQL